MLCQPSPTSRPHACCCKIDRTCYAPQIRVMMCYPALSTIQFLSRFSTAFTQLLHHLEQGLMCFGKVGDLRRPVVHLGIYINGVYTIPSGTQRPIPDALQISRFPYRLGRADEKVSLELC